MEYPCALEFVPDHLKSEEMCEKAVWEEPSLCNMFPIGL